MHPTQKTIDMLRRASERINKLTRATRKQFEDEVFNPPLRAKVTKKRAVDKHTPGGQEHDQDSHGRRGRVGPRGDASDDDETTMVSLGGDNSIPEDLLDHLKDLRSKGHSYKSLVDEVVENNPQGRKWYGDKYEGNSFDLRQDLESLMEDDDDEKVAKDVQEPTNQITIPGNDRTGYQKRGSVKPKGNKIRKHPGHSDQSVHSPTGQPAKKPARSMQEAASRVLGQESKSRANIPVTMRSPEDANNVMHHVKTGLKNKIPYVSAQVSTLGGKHRPSVMLTVSLDPKETWTNGILENSRYGKIDIRHDGRVELFSGTLRLRSSRPKSVEHLVSMLTNKLKERDTSDMRNKPRKMAKHLGGKHDERTHGRRRVVGQAAAAGAAGALAGRGIGRVAGPALRGLATTAAASRAISGLSRTVDRINPKGVKKFRRLKRRATRALRRHTAKLSRAIAPAAKAGLRLASRVKVPGVIGIGLMAAAAGLGLVAQRARKMQKARGLTAGDHVLVLSGDEAIVGVYAGNETVRVLTNDSYVDAKPPKNDVLLIERGNTVPDENSSSDEIATLADTLSREKQVMENLSEKVKDGKVSKRSVDKHAMGQHDQKTHGNRATRAVRAVRAKARRIGRRVTSGIRQAGKTIEATTQTTRQVADDLDSVLQGLEAGTRIYDKVKSLKDSLLGESEKMTKAEMSDKELAESKRLAERLKGKKDIENPHALARWQVQQKLTKLEQLVGSIMKQRKTPKRYSPPKSLRSSPSFMITPGRFGSSAKPKTMPLKPGSRTAPSARTMPRRPRRMLPRMTRKFDDVQAAFEKGIGHSLRTLTNALDLIREQEADKKISEADEKKLQEIIREIRSMVGYLEEVKEQGFFEKGEAAVPDSTTTYRPSFTTPAVADHLKRQGIKPNAKGRGTNTGREPGY